MAKGVVGAFAKRYGAVIFFPTFAVTTIFADWNHTRQWKRSLKAKQQESNSH